MNQSELLEKTISKITSVLDRLGLQYHFTGGLVSSLYGEPRFTQDIDIVIRFADPANDAQKIIDSFQEDFVLAPQLIQEAANQKGMFQLLDNETWMKVDMHVGEAIPGELNRSRRDEILPGLQVLMVSPEDANISLPLLKISASAILERE